MLHTHVVVGNLTHGPDGRWTALDGRHLYRHAKAAGCLYQAALRDELSERLGVGWTEVHAGTAEVLGVQREVIEHFSRRRRAILDELERGGPQFCEGCSGGDARHAPGQGAAAIDGSLEGEVAFARGRART